MNFKYQLWRNNSAPEQVAEKVAETLRNNGLNVTQNASEISVSGLISYFNNGNAVINVDEKSINLSGNVKPNIAAMVCLGISIVLDIIGLFSECELEAVLGMALIIALGAAGTVGSIITFFFGKALLQHNLVALINSVEK